MTPDIFAHRPIQQFMQQDTEMKLESAKMRGFLPQSPQISVPDNELSKTGIVPSLMYEN
jgi:hypothetical protein